MLASRYCLYKHLIVLQNDKIPIEQVYISHLNVGKQLEKLLNKCPYGQLLNFNRNRRRYQFLCLFVNRICRGFTQSGSVFWSKSREQGEATF